MTKKIVVKKKLTKNLSKKSLFDLYDFMPQKSGFLGV
jgi:hypothetical protein